MRIRRVETCGFGPFRDTQVVDLAAFDSDGLFLIAGDTGAGKSTILDAIAYALYGDTPRWDDVNATPRFRSDYCDLDDPTRVVLEFEAGAVEYRLTRSPEYQRPKARGIGTTTNKATALLEHHVDGQWLGLADKPRDVSLRVDELVRLTQAEFLQVILLAQNRFHRFLLAPSDERLGLLSKLFGAQRFRDFQNRIADKRKALKDAAEAAGIERSALLRAVTADEALGEATVGGELTWVDAVIAAAVDRVRLAATAVSVATTAERSALERRSIAERQLRKHTAETALTALAARRAQIDEIKAHITAAERAERVRPLVDAGADAAQALERAQEAVDGARSAYPGPVADDDLPAEVTRLDQAIGALTDAVTDERGATRLERELDEQRARADQLATAVREAIARIDGLVAERGLLGALAAQAAALAAERDRAAERWHAAVSADRTVEDLLAAQQAQLAADTACTRARARADDLLRRHLRGQAAQLATGLVDGEPCAVCGSREHPAPAVGDADLVDLDAVDEAKAEADSLGPAATEALEHVNALRTEAARLRALAGDTAADVLQAALDQAALDLAGAGAAQDRIDAIEAELDGDEGLHARTDLLRTDLGTAATQVTTLTTTLTDLRTRLDALRGAHPSVTDRHGSLTAERTAAKQLADALAGVRAVSQNLATTQAQLDAKATGEGFESVEAAVAALLDATTVTAHRRTATAHDQAVDQARGQLASTDLQDLPGEVIDLGEARSALADASSRKDTAAKEHTTAENAVDLLTTQRTELAELLERSAGLAAEYDVLDRLANSVNGKAPNSTGMSLQSYYVAAELEAVLAAANVRLRTMTGGRYELQHTERGILYANARAGLELEVMDENTGKARDPHTLSGGEQFLASLALALGLAEVVTGRAGGVVLDTLFVDEGFGSLSPEFLEIAMSTLDSLKSGGRTVGVISHVESMKESIGARLLVVREPGGWSTIVQST